MCVLPHDMQVQQACRVRALTTQQHARLEEKSVSARGGGGKAAVKAGCPNSSGRVRRVDGVRLSWTERTGAHIGWRDGRGGVEVEEEGGGIDASKGK